MKDFEQKICDVMNSTRNELIFQLNKAYDKGYKDGQAATPFTDTEEAEEKAYNRGLNDAWDAARKIAGDITDGGYSLDELHEIFNETFRIIFKRNTASEAIAKIKEYEDEQKQDAEIKTGDEVIGTDSGKRAVILDKKYGLYRALTFDGIIHEGTEEAFTKTGRTFPQIAEALKELRGAENDK